MTDETGKQTDTATATQLWVFRVRVRRSGRVFLYLAPDNNLKVGDNCIVNTERGMEVGTCVSTPQFCDNKHAERVLSRIVRAATPRDMDRHAENEDFERDAYKQCSAMIEDRKMPMKLVFVESTFDRKKVVFYFSAENRVDFRDLVKDLACKFRTRIELRQIGVRDEARLIGGLGVCGRPACCATFLKKFAPVSIRMAKKQNLALNPAKISGLCGRLMCCILFEDDQYTDKCARHSKNAACGECGIHDNVAKEVNAVVKTMDVAEAGPDETPPAKQTKKNSSRRAKKKKKKGRQSRRRRGRRRKKRGNSVD